MLPVKFKSCNAVFGAGQLEYLPLPAKKHGDIYGTVTTCWKLDWKERLQLLFTGKLWLQQLTYNQALQPQRPTVKVSEL